MAISVFDSINDLEVINNDEALMAAGNNCTGLGFPPREILKPQNTSAVQALVQMAAHHNLALYPSSCGRNWGLGSRALPQANAILVDFSAMNNITHYDPDNGQVSLQPGVSFAQLSDFLKHQGSNWQASVIGGPSTASVLANALERGDGIGRQGDRATSINNIQAVLGNGRIVTSGHNNSAAHWHSYPLGPDTQSLFIQSNFGLVCGADLQLAPKAVDTLFAMLDVNNSEAWHTLIDSCKAMLREQLVEPRAISFWNGAKRQARIKPCKQWPQESLTQSQLSAWSATFFVQTFHPNMMSAKMAMLRPLLGDLNTRLQVFNDRDKQGETIPSQATGTPSDDNLRSLYWQKDSVPTSKNLDPDADQCGCLWLCLAAPFEAHQLNKGLTELDNIMQRKGFNPNLGFQVADHKAVHLFVAIIYDRDQEDQQNHAMACHEEILNYCNDIQWPLIRAGLPSMQQVKALPANRRQWLQEIKQVSDPKMIIAPGRYIF